MTAAAPWQPNRAPIVPIGGERDTNAECESSSVPASGAGGRYLGRVKSLGAQYGFIECSETRQEFGRDVHVNIDDLPNGGDAVGAHVSFRVMVSEKGRPQARDIESEQPLSARTESGTTCSGGPPLESSEVLEAGMALETCAQPERLRTPTDPWADIEYSEEELEIAGDVPSKRRERRRRGGRRQGVDEAENWNTAEATRIRGEDRRRRGNEGDGEAQVPSELGRSRMFQGMFQAGENGRRFRRGEAEVSRSDFELDGSTRPRQARAKSRTLELSAKSGGIRILQPSDAIEDWDEPMATMEFGQDQATGASSSTGGFSAGLPLQQLQSCAWSRSPSPCPRMRSGHESPATGSEGVADLPPGGDSAQEFLSDIDGELCRLLRAPPGAMLNLPCLATSFRALLDVASARYHMEVVDEHSSGRGEVNVTATAETWSMESLGALPGKSLTRCPGLRIWPTCDLAPYLVPVDTSFAVQAQEFVPAVEFRPAPSLASLAPLQSQCSLSVAAPMFEPGALSAAVSERYLSSNGGACLVDEQGRIGTSYGVDFDPRSEVATDVNVEEFSIEAQSGWSHHYAVATCTSDDISYERSMFPIPATEFISAGAAFNGSGHVSLSPSAPEFTPSIGQGTTPSSQTQFSGSGAGCHQGPGIGFCSGVQSGLSASAPNFVPMIAPTSDGAIQSTSAALSSAAPDFSPGAEAFFPKGQLSAELSADAAEFKPLVGVPTVTGPPPGSFIPGPPPGPPPFSHSPGESLPSNLDARTVLPPPPPGYTAPLCAPAHWSVSPAGRGRDQDSFHQGVDPPKWDADIPKQNGLDHRLLPSKARSGRARGSDSQDDVDFGRGISGALRARAGDHGCDEDDWRQEEQNKCNGWADDDRHRQDGWSQGGWKQEEQESWQRKKRDGWADDDRHHEESWGQKKRNGWAEDWKAEDPRWEREGWNRVGERERPPEWSAPTRGWSEGNDGWQEDRWQNETRTGAGDDRPGKLRLRREPLSNSSDTGSVSGSEGDAMHGEGRRRRGHAGKGMPNSSTSAGPVQHGLDNTRPPQPAFVATNRPTVADSQSDEQQASEKPVSTIDKSAFHRMALGHLLGKREPRNRGS